MFSQIQFKSTLSWGKKKKNLHFIWKCKRR